MALFSLVIRCAEVGQQVAQFEARSPYRAVGALLASTILRDMTAKHKDWPNDFSLRDVYAFIPMEGLAGVFFCGLGARGKYVTINIFRTARRSSSSERYCGPRRGTVTLR